VAHWSGRGLWLWSAAGAPLGRAVRQDSELQSVAFSPDGATLAAGDDHATVCLYDTAAPLSGAVRLVLPGFYRPWQVVRATSHGVVAATESAIGSLGTDGNLKWQAMEPIQSPAAPPAYVRPALRDLLISADGALQVEAVYFTPYTATMMGQGIPMGEVRARDRQTGAILWRKADTGRSQTPALALAPDGSLFMGKPGWSVSRAGTPADDWVGLHRWDAKTGAEQPLDIAWDTKQGPQPPRGMDAVTVSADGSRAVIQDPNMLHYVDLDAKQQLQWFRSGSMSDYKVVLSADGHWMAGAAPDGRVLLWDMARQRPDWDIHADVVFDTAPTGTPGSRAHLAYAPDGKLAAGLGDGRVLVWPPNPGMTTTPLWETAPRDAVTALAWSHDGQRLWIGDHRGDLRARDGATGKLISSLRLLPPAAEGGPDRWMRWDGEGKLVR